VRLGKGVVNWIINYQKLVENTLDFSTVVVDNLFDNWEQIFVQQGVRKYTTLSRTGSNLWVFILVLLAFIQENTKFSSVFPVCVGVMKD
jgi:hypothetical protein